jgi:hypothetical protein
MVKLMVDSVCKICNIKITNEKYINLCSTSCREKNTANIKRAYYDRNKELVKQRAADNRKKNLERYKQKDKLRRLKNKDKAKEAQAKYKAKNYEKIRKRVNAFNNTPERKAYMKNYRKLPGVKDREKESGKRYYLRNRHIEKNGHLKRTFNITLEQYNEMLNGQNNVCAICRKPETKVFKKTGKINDLAVDHCHSSGKIRGLLCWRCNTAIGRFEDSTDLLQNAIEYLKNRG